MLIFNILDLFHNFDIQMNSNLNYEFKIMNYEEEN